MAYEPTTEPVTDLIRQRLRELKSGGRTYKDVAREAGLAPSMISQLMLETSQATIYNATRLAKPLGYRDLPALVNAAYARARGAEAAEPAPQRAQAIAFALEHGVTMEQIDRAIRRFADARFEEMDAVWWLSRFHEERSLDADIRAYDKALNHLAGFEEKQQKKQARAEWRGRKKKRTPDTAPPPAATKRRATGG